MVKDGEQRAASGELKKGEWRIEKNDAWRMANGGQS
jgi:hypothetical protein